MSKTAIVAGSTGLVGQALLEQLSADERYGQIIALTRSPIQSQSPKTNYLIVDFDNLTATKTQLIGDDAFCCLGTTRQKAGSKEAFYKVDYTYVWNFARLCAQNKVRNFVLVSAMGADKNSLFYYNEVKGKIEEAVSQLDFEKVIIVRPSLLLGDRKEERLGEDIAKSFVKLFSPLIPAKYDGIEAKQVAKAMIVASNSNAYNGLCIIESDKLQTM